MKNINSESRFKYVIVLCIFFILNGACTDSQLNTEVTKSSPTETKVQYYNRIMKERKFLLRQLDSCNEEELDEDTWDTYFWEVDHFELENSVLSVDFKMNATCCRVFMGDYTIVNDTLVFSYEAVNDEACDCYCVYCYNLTVHDVKVDVKGFKLEQLVDK